jgi:hypothetical protein
MTAKDDIEQPRDERADNELVVRLAPRGKNAKSKDDVLRGIRFFAHEYYGWDVSP